MTSMSPDLVEGHGLSDEPERPEAEKELTGRSPMQIALGRLRRDPIAVICFVIVLLFTIVAVFAGPLCSLFGVSLDTVLASQRVDLVTGLPLTGPPNHGFDSDHPFGIAPGTGNDNLAYWIHGCRTSLWLGFMATVLSTLIGVALGLVAGFVGGLADAVISFFTDLFLTLPFLLAALALAPIIADRFGTNVELYNELTFWTLVGILVVFGWMGVARHRPRRGALAARA